MFDLSSIIGTQVDALRPVAHSVAEEFRAFGAQVIERFDTLIDAVQPPADAPEQRVYITGVADVFTVVDTGHSIPPTETWELECVTLNGTVKTNVRLYSSPINDPGTNVDPGDELPPLWGGVTEENSAVTKGGDGVIVRGNTKLYVYGGSAPADYRFQFKRRRIAPSKSTTAGGITNVNPDTTTVEDTEVYRHTGTWAPNR
jgi:hypothetical protein